MCNDVADVDDASLSDRIEDAVDYRLVVALNPRRLRRRGAYNLVEACRCGRRLKCVLVESFPWSACRCGCGSVRPACPSSTPAADPSSAGPPDALPPGRRRLPRGVRPLAAPALGRAEGDRVGRWSLLLRGLAPVTACEAARRPSERLLAVTFDDALRRVNDAAGSRALGVPATTSACVAFSEDGRRFDILEMGRRSKKALFDVLTAMGWEELRAAAEQGAEIGSHTVSHPHLPCSGMSYTGGS